MASRKTQSQRQSSDYPRVLIGVPLERTIPQATFWSFIAIAMQGFPFVQQSYQRTDVARNEMAKTLLNSDCTHLLMLDIDHNHPYDIVARLGRWVREDPKKLVIGGLNFRRGAPYEPMAYWLTEDNKYRHVPTDTGELIEVDAMATASMLVAREVFEKLEPPWFRYEYKRESEGKHTSEDMVFCRACKAAGIKLYVDTTCTSPHLIDSFVDRAVFERWAENDNH